MKARNVDNDAMSMDNSDSIWAGMVGVVSEV